MSSASSTIFLPPLAQLCIRSCSNKQQLMMSFICSYRNKIGAELHIYLENGAYHKRLFRGNCLPTPHTTPFFLPPEDYPVLHRPNSTPQWEPYPTAARRPRRPQSGTREKESELIEFMGVCVYYCKTTVTVTGTPSPSPTATRNRDSGLKRLVVMWKLERAGEILMMTSTLISDHSHVCVSEPGG